MSVDLGLEITRPQAVNPLRRFLMPVVVAIAYFITAEIAFLIGTLSDRIFAPFWPPNIILFCALLTAPMRQWPHYLIAVFPAHAIAEFGVGMPLWPMVIAFLTNTGVAATNAYVMRKLVEGPPWLHSLRTAMIYVLTTALISPAVWALPGALVQAVSSGGFDFYWTYWVQWYAANALASVALGPFAIILFCERRWFARLLPRRRLVEFAALMAFSLAAWVIAFQAGGSRIAGGLLPTVLYLPLPLVVWSAARFGGAGVASSIFIATAVAIWRGLDGPSPFISGSVEDNVFALQTFLIGLSAPLILLGAAVDEARRFASDRREAEQRMAFVAASANIGLWQLSDNGKQFWATDYCRSMLGFKSSQTVGWNDVLNLVHVDDRDIVTRAIDDARSSNDGTSCEFRIVGSSSSIHWLTMTAHVEAAESQPFPISGLFSDTTLRKSAEAELELQRRELAHLMRVSMMGELSGALAHEINQPLTAILANAEAARRLITKGRPDLDEIHEILDDIVEDDNRAGEVIQRIHRLLRKGDHKSEPVDINELVTSTLRLVHSQLINRRVKTRVSLGKTLPLPTGDTIQLQQVLLNIIMNAVDAMAATTQSRRVLAIETRLTPNAHIETVITDRGPGLTEEQQKRLFEPFFTTKDQGLGLGLAICSTIVAAHGGQIRITDNGEGTTAIVSLPVDVSSYLVEAV